VTASAGLDLAKALNIFYRRKGIIAAVALGSVSLATYLAVSLPDVYRSNTLMLITPQRLPPSYIHSTVTSSIQQRIRAIAQQILSRGSLEKIIKDFDLYPSSEGGGIESRVAELKRRIHIDSRREDAFQLSFDAANPETAMRVTARLASLFLEEDLNAREQQVMGTTTFINAEADRLRDELEVQETKVNQFKAQYRFELPDQVNVNLKTLEQLQGELKNNLLYLSSLHERKSSVEKELVEAETITPERKIGWELDGGQRGTPWQQVESRKKQLEALLVLYSDKYPDIIRLRQQIAALEANGPVENPVRQLLGKQLADLKTEINSLQAKNESLRGHIVAAQVRIDSTPIRAIELSKISRTYDITYKKYQDLLAKGLDSRLSENMEKKQKGEQFQIIDPADFPEKPVRPNRPLILLIGGLGGLIVGFGLALVWDNLDTSFTRTDELHGCVDLPLLAAIPSWSVVEQRRSQAMLFLASIGVVMAGILSIRLLGPLFF
jgi:polysaccharide chain length determinant protein (PEP-CTERM system associated)